MKCVITLCVILFNITLAFATPDQARGPVRARALDIANPNIENRVHREGNVWLNITNYGYFGNNGPDQGGAELDSCRGQSWASQGEYPAGSSQQYLYQGALWIGALVMEGDAWVPRVSVGIDGWFNPEIDEYFPGDGPADGIREISNVPEKVNCFGEQVYSPDAVANEEFIATYSDTLNDPFWLTEDPMDGPHHPLDVQVTQRSMAWSSPEFDDFIIFEFSVRNMGTESLRNVYLGLYMDPDVGLAGEAGHQTDDMTGLFSVDTLTGDTFNIAWAADNDGWPAVDPGGPLLYPHVSGIYVLRPPNSQAAWSYNWWVSNGDFAGDLGPTWSAYADRDSLGMSWTELYGTPVGDHHKYDLLRNEEMDYASYNVYNAEYIAAHPQLVTDPCTGATLTEQWAAPPPPPEDPLGMDLRYLISYGPLGAFDHLDSTGACIYRLDPGDSVSLTLAYVFGQYFHNPHNPQIPFAPTDPSKFDFSDLLHNARRARLMHESGYAYQPPVRPLHFRPSGILSSAVPLTWIPPAQPQITGYNIFGVDAANSQVQFNTEPVPETTFTVTGLPDGSDWLFRIQSIGDSGFTSGYADTLVRVGAPFPIRGLTARVDSGAIRLHWIASGDPEFTNYRVLRLSSVTGDSISFICTASIYVDSMVVLGRIYTYWVVAENSRGIMSLLGNVVSAMAWNPERRILVIDDTDTCHTLDYLRGGINDDSVAAMYNRLLSATGEGYDVIVQPDHGLAVYTLEMLAHYDLVIWHSENNLATNPSWEANQAREEMFQQYVSAGGRLLSIGRRMLYQSFDVQDWASGIWLDEQMSPLTFDSVLAAGRLTASNPGMEFTGGTAVDTTFPNFTLDTAKVHSLTFGSVHLDYLPEIDVFWPRGETLPLYRSVVLPTDSSELGNQPVAVIGSREILLGFPLYFLPEDDAQAVLDASIVALRTYPFGVNPEPPPPLPTTVRLEQNYPNPFNNSTTLRFELPQAGPVKLTIYNLLGQEVAVLVDQSLTAGSHAVAWDAESLASGLYLARLEAASSVRTVKVVLLR